MMVDDIPVQFKTFPAVTSDFSFWNRQYIRQICPAEKITRALIKHIAGHKMSGDYEGLARRLRSATLDENMGGRGLYYLVPCSFVSLCGDF
jgi:hypothetical protein